MARIAGVDIPANKRIRTSLTYIYGVGDHRALEICTKAKIDPEIKTRDLTEEQTRSIIGICPDMPVVLCTGYSELMNEAKARAIGVRQFVLKPVMRIEIANAVRRAIDE